MKQGMSFRLCSSFAHLRIVVYSNNNLLIVTTGSDTEETKLGITLHSAILYELYYIFQRAVQKQEFVWKWRWSLHHIPMFCGGVFHVCLCSERLLTGRSTNHPEVLILLLSDYRIFTSSTFFESWQHNGLGQCQIIICMLASLEEAVL